MPAQHDRPSHQCSNSLLTALRSARRVGPDGAYFRRVYRSTQNNVTPKRTKADVMATSTTKSVDIELLPSLANATHHGLGALPCFDLDQSILA